MFTASDLEPVHRQLVKMMMVRMMLLLAVMLVMMMLVLAVSDRASLPL